MLHEHDYDVSVTGYDQTFKILVFEHEHHGFDWFRGLAFRPTGSAVLGVVHPIKSLIMNELLEVIPNRSPNLKDR